MPLPALTASFAKPKVIIGEGRDEVNFFEALCDHLHLIDVQVEQYGGKGQLSRYLREFNVRPGHQNVVALGITRDADASVAPVFQGICGLLHLNGLPAPATAGQIAPGPPRVGVFIMPDNRREGMLEDLCLDAVLSDGAMPCVDDYFRSVSQNTSRQPSPMAKARVHAWLASQADPDLRLGEAAKRDYWPWNTAAFQTLIQFLRGL
jgi:hypothetical protein